jgi:hypothetical protein
MTTNYQTTYHMDGIVVEGGINVSDGIIEGISKLFIGDWVIELTDDNCLNIRNNSNNIATLKNNPPHISTNIKYTRLLLLTDKKIQDCIGMFVSSNKKFYNMDYTQSPNTISETLPIVTLSSIPSDPGIIGIISDVENDTREYNIGLLSCIVEQEDNINRVLVNTDGLGVCWVCDINGLFSCGDYITTSNIPGIGMKQDDDLKHNYTGPRIMHDCDFNPLKISLKKPLRNEPLMSSNIFKSIKNINGKTIKDTEYQIIYVSLDGSRTTRTCYENEIDMLTKNKKKDVETILKSSKRTIYRCCLVSYCY